MQNYTPFDYLVVDSVFRERFSVFIAINRRCKIVNALKLNDENLIRCILLLTLI